MSRPAPIPADARPPRGALRRRHRASIDDAVAAAEDGRRREAADGSRPVEPSASRSSIADLERTAAERDEYLDALAAAAGRVRELPQAGGQAAGDEVTARGAPSARRAAAARARRLRRRRRPRRRPTSSPISPTLLDDAREGGPRAHRPGGRAVRPQPARGRACTSRATAATPPWSPSPAHRLPWKGRVAAPGHGEGQGLGTATDEHPHTRSGSRRTTTSPRRRRDGRRRRRSRARTGSWPASSTPTPTPATPRPRSGSRSLRRLRRRRRRREAQGVRRGPRAGPDGRRRLRRPGGPGGAGPGGFTFDMGGGGFGDLLGNLFGGGAGGRGGAQLPYTIRSIVPRLLNPCASARLANPNKQVPVTSATAFGNPIPTFIYAPPPLLLQIGRKVRCAANRA